VIGRLRPELTLRQAQAALEPTATSLRQAYPQVNEGHDILVRPVSDELFSNVGGSGGVAFGGAVLFAIVGLVLAIACSNVANLLLARATVRRQEIAVRLAIGAHRGRLVRQLLTESVLLSLVSCVAGLGIGYAGCRFIWSFVPAEVASNMLAPKLDGVVLAFAVLVSLATAFVFGLSPALRASKTDLVTALKEETRTAGRARRAVNFSNLLLAGQVAFSLVCLITAALFFRSIQRAYTIDPGIDTKHLALFMMNPAQAGYDDVRVKTFYREARERVGALPGIVSVTWVSGPPFWHSPSRSILIEGRAQRKGSDTIATVDFTVDTDFFRTLAIPLHAGRAFTESDDDKAPAVAIVNQALAQAYWPHGDAVGRHFRFAGDNQLRQVVGVAATANYTTLGEAPQPCVYVPLRQNYTEGMTLYIRSGADPATALKAVEHAIRDLDPNMHISDVRTGAKLVGQVLWAPMVGVSLLGVFGSLALALASVGLYGVMAYSVAGRRREIGVRLALGASRSTVLGFIVREGMVLAGVGIAVGLIACLAVGRLLSRMLFGISPADPLSLAAASGVLTAVALLACYLPARSATRIDPMIALRDY
jgi:predicted permease